MVKSIVLWQAKRVRLRIIMHVHITAMVINWENCDSKETVTQPTNPDMVRVKRIRRMILMGCFLRILLKRNRIPRPEAMAKHDHEAISTLFDISSYFDRS